MNEKQMNEFRKFKYDNFGTSLSSEQSAIAEKFWQAAIASVVVELPELEGVDGECENFNNGFYAGYQDCMGDIKKSIELAGIRYE